MKSMNVKSRHIVKITVEYKDKKYGKGEYKVDYEVKEDEYPLCFNRGSIYIENKERNSMVVISADIVKSVEYSYG